MPRGFTIMELLISIAIFMFLTTITVFGFRSAGQANNLRQNSVNLVAAFRRAQNLAQSGGTVTLCSGLLPMQRCDSDFDCPAMNPCTDVESPPLGFGLSFSSGNPDQVTLYADMNDVGGVYDSAKRLTIKDGLVSLMDDVSVEETRPATTPLTVTFEPQSRSILVNNVENVADPVTYCLTNSHLPNAHRVVTVQPVSGLIEEVGALSCPT